jgi:hypothetical protein
MGQALECLLCKWSSNLSPTKNQKSDHFFKENNLIPQELQHLQNPFSFVSEHGVCGECLQIEKRRQLKILNDILVTVCAYREKVT